MNGKRIEAKEPRETDVAGGGVTCQSSEAEIGPSGESGVGVNRKDLLEEIRLSVGQSWDFSQVEDELGEMRWTGSRMMG